MKKILITVILICTAVQLFSQTLEKEKEYYNSQIQEGKLTTEQVTKLQLKWNAFVSKYKYPVLPLNKVTGEVDFTDVLTFPDIDKKEIYVRSLEWIAVNYGNILHKDPEAGKIIASGNLNIKHKAEYAGSSGRKEEFSTTSTVYYVLILTIKDGKLKYSITNIEFTFSGYSATVDNITLPIDALFPLVAADEMQWRRYISILNESTDRFSVVLKDALKVYINGTKEDYNF